MPASKNLTLIDPYGGELVDLMVPAEAFDEQKAYASQLPSVQISPRSVCDLELLATGAFSPIDRFLGREDHQCVLDEMRLVEGHLFPIPVTLPVAASSELRLDQDIALRNSEYELLAIMSVREIYTWDRNEVTHKVFGTQDFRHPLVAEMHSWGQLNISGPIQMLQLPRYYDFPDLRLTPVQTRAKLAAMGRQNVISFEPYHTLLHALQSVTDVGIEQVDGTILLHPVVGLTRLGDFDYYANIRMYQALVDDYLEPNRILLTLFPLATRLAGPREALWQTLIRRNYGVNCVIGCRDWASPPASSNGHRFYDSNKAQELVEEYSQELGVKLIPSQYLANVSNSEQSKKGFKVTSGSSIASHSTNRSTNDNGRKAGLQIQNDVANLWAMANPPRHQQGVTVWFTGLSGSGKSTTAEMLTWLLLDHGRRVVVLDGDVVRTHLSKGLTFSKEDRDTNVRRIGFVASELVRLGGVVICAVVSPYQAARNDVRMMVGQDKFVEVFVDTPLEVCENRDVKGMYARARSGEIKGFTGIEDPYEPPLDPEIRLDTVNFTAEENARKILNYLIAEGFACARQNKK